MPFATPWLAALPLLLMAAPAELAVHPASVSLRYAHDRHALLVSERSADGAERDLTRSVMFTSSAPAVAVVSPAGVVTAVSPGTATVLVSDPSGRSVNVAITVAAAQQPPVSFANEVMPILSRAGCNQGACHGAASGKKGFKVSLRGYDPAVDHAVLTRGSEGRRLNRLSPDQSLLILKGVGAVPHEGGKRFEADSDDARTLARWIAEGAGNDLPTADQLVGLEVVPSTRIFAQPTGSQSLLVVARYADGSRRDVTSWARFSSSNETVALPDDAGQVRLLNRGEAAIAARFGPLQAVATFLVLRHDPAFTWPNPPVVNDIDRLVFAKLRQMQIAPSDLSRDTEFLRRVSLDLTGLPPTPDEVRAFLADNRADKRDRKIDELLARPEHAEWWALKWADLLKVRADTLRDKGTWGVYRWLRDAVAANRPFDQVVRDLLTAEGSCAEQAPANFTRAFPTADEAGEATAQVTP